MSCCLIFGSLITLHILQDQVNRLTAHLPFIYLYNICNLNINIGIIYVLSMSLNVNVERGLKRIMTFFNYFTASIKAVDWRLIDD